MTMSFDMNTSSNFVCSFGVFEPPPASFLVKQSTLGRGQIRTNDRTLSCVGAKCLWAKGPRVSRKSIAPVQTRFVLVQPHVAPAQQAFCSYVCKDLLRPLQSTLGQISWFDLCPSQPGLQLSSLSLIESRTCEVGPGISKQ